MATSVYEALAEGLACQEQGRLEEAERLYSAVLDCDPSTADAWHLLGMVRMGRRQFPAAAGCVAKAIRLRPDLPAYHTTLGDILVGQGRGGQASMCYEEALRRDPCFTPALVNLGNLLQSQGRLREAVAVYARAIDTPGGCAEALNNLGNTLSAMGRPQDAMACYREAFRVGPEGPDAPVNLAALCLREHRDSEAEEWARLALKLRPGLTAALSNLSIALVNQQRFAEAEEPARQALAQAPGAAHLHANVASVLLHQKRWVEAERECRRALELRPGQPEAVNNLGVVFQFTDRLEEAAAQFRQVLTGQPEDADAWTNLGTVHAAEARHDEALGCFEEALRHDPGHAKAHFCHSLEVLGRGRWEEGFREYEWRWKVVKVPRGNAGPVWDGSPLEGRTILLSAEQGLGDTIQFARYIPRIAALGGRVVVECQPAAAAIVRSVPGVAGVISPEEPLPDFAVQSPLMSLPRIFGLGELGMGELGMGEFGRVEHGSVEGGLAGSLADRVPNQIPYVAFDRELAARMARQLGPRRRLRIGLAWAGNPENGGDRRRSMPLAALAPLRGVAGMEWFSLHVGAKAREAVRAGGGWMREVLSDGGGLPELAALMSLLDLVITVDTMPAHLAGALGRPVWNLLCAAPDWRWTRAGERSPWYPTMRLFRQATPGDWEGVMERVIQELSSFPAQAFPGGIDT